MKLLVTGASGQFGQAFRGSAAMDHDIIATSSREAPGTTRMPLEDGERVGRVVAKEQPDWIVHAAAFTDVDGCQRDPERAWRINVDGTSHVAQAAVEFGARLAVLSTDYVFDGRKGDYRETDATGPLSVYGRTKLAGEEAAVAAAADCLVARTAVMFAPGHRNFVTWLHDELAAGRPVRAITDQRVSPTLADDLVCQVMALIEADADGVFHTAGADALTRHDMAVAVADRFGLDASLVEPVTMDQVPWLAPRPRDSSLSVDKVRRHAAPMTFAEALDAVAEVIAA